MNRLLRVVSIGTFAIWLVLPLVFLVRPHQFCEPVDENRRQRELPAASLWLNPLCFSTTATSLCGWFEDHFGLRDLMIRTKNQIDFTVFRKSDKVHVGPGGWLFLRHSLDNYAIGLEKLPPSYVDAQVGKMAKLAAHLKARGIQLIVLTIPLKWTIYPEFLPTSAPQLPPLADRRYDYWRKNLSTNPAFVHVDSLASLEATKQETDAFYRTDFHWSEISALRVAKDVVRTAATLTASAIPPSRFHEEFETTTLRGDSSRFLPIWNQPSEEALVFKYKEIIPPQDAEPPFQMVFRNPDDSLLPPTVFLGDSFFWNLFFSGFQRHFSTLYFGHIQRPSAKDILQNPPPGTRLIVIELLETNFPISFELDP